MAWVLTFRAEELTSFLNKDHIGPNIVSPMILILFLSFHSLSVQNLKKLKTSLDNQDNISIKVEKMPFKHFRNVLSLVRWMFFWRWEAKYRIVCWYKTFSCVANGKWKRRFWSRLLNSGHSLHLSAFLSSAPNIQVWPNHLTETSLNIWKITI